MTEDGQAREHMMDRLLRARPAASTPAPTESDSTPVGRWTGRADDEARALQLVIAVIARDEDEWRRLNSETWTRTAQPGGLRAIWYLLEVGYARAARRAAQVEQEPQQVLAALREQLALLEGQS